MTPQLQELLFLVRQHKAFKEFREAVQPPAPRLYRPTDDPQKFTAETIYRSGQQRQHDAWLSFLTGEPTSQQEKS